MASFSAHGSTVDEVVLNEMKAHGIAGVSLAIIEGGRIVRAEGYGFTDRSRTSPVSVKTLFQAGSISKPVAALGALRLVESGKLSLDGNVNQALQQWQIPENEHTSDETVTLRRILSHSAGLTVHGFPGYNADAPLPTLLQVLDGFKPANTPAVRVDLVPGSSRRYSGGGYTVMQQMMVDVTKKPFPQLMNETVLTPLQMTASSYQQPLPKDKVTSAATGHYPDGGAVDGKWHTRPEMAAAGLWTTPSDLARFAIAIQDSLAGRSNPLISVAMTRQLLSVQKDQNGLGFFLKGDGNLLSFSHGGRNEGFDAFLLAGAESGHGVFIMINANDNSGVLSRIADFVRKEHRWPDAR